jgi:hypothetical protein
MPIIGGRFYANPAYGKALEEARDADAGGDASAAHQTGPAHHIHVQREPDGIKVHVHRHGPGGQDASPEPSGSWETHTFEPDDHHGAGEFVKKQLARR